jgi:hypothetical protein
VRYYEAKVRRFAAKRAEAVADPGLSGIQSLE